MGLGKRIISADAGGVVGTEHFNPYTYTGNGSTQAFSNVGFRPDWVWIKPRETTTNHGAYDSIRGASQYLAPDVNGAGVSLAPNGVTAFGSGGFTVVDDSGGNNNANGAPGGANSGTNATYIAWVWRAGGAPTATNSGGSSPTSGSVMIDGVASSASLSGSNPPKKLSANTVSGFSIVQATATSASSSTIDHGLTVAPELIIEKNFSNVDSWNTFVSALGNTKALFLDTDALPSTNSSFWNNTSPTSDVFTVASRTNAENYIYYCFHSVAGYQKIGTYTGNNSTSNVVTTGFQPRFLLLKKTTGSTGDWKIIDSGRSSSNPRDKALEASSNGIEDSGSNFNVNFNSNDFTIATTNVEYNDDGETYIYLAIA